MSDHDEQNREKVWTWEAIGGRFGRTDKTAKRWWREQGLPVRRVRLGGKFRYYAFTDELDDWYRKREENLTDSEQGESDGRRGGHTPAARAGSWRWPIYVAIPLTAAIAAALLLLRGGDQPFGCEVQGTNLRVVDDRGAVLWQVNDSPEAKNAEIIRVGRPPCLVTDVDGVDGNEVYFNYAPEDYLGQGGRLEAYTGDGHLRWRYDYGRELRIRGRYYEPHYLEAFLRVVSGRDATYLLVASHHPVWHPSHTVLVDPQTGRVVSEYLHTGWFYDIAQLDIDGDGVDEILLGGISNPGRRHPAIAILPVPFDSVKADLEGVANYFGDGNAVEARYLLYPQPDLFAVRDMGVGVSHIRVSEGRIMVVLGGAVAGQLVYTYLDSEFRVTEVRPSSAALAEHNRLHREGLLDHDWGEEDRQYLRQLLALPTAPDVDAEPIREHFATAAAATTRHELANR